MSRTPLDDNDKREPTPPDTLGRMQSAFGHAIARPFVFEPGDSGDYSLQVEHYDPALLRDIRPRARATPAERLGIYNQQYWFRLLTVMQEEYPLTERLLGTLAFNQMVMAYLDQWPSHSYSLHDLSNRLSEFLDQAHRWNEPLLKQSARLEFAFIQAFDLRAEPVFEPLSLSEAERERVALEPLRLQPHWSLFEEHWNLVECRRQVKQGDTAAVTPIPQHGHWAIYRAADGTRSRRLGPLQYRLLELLQRGVALGQAVEQLVEQLIEDLIDEQASDEVAFVAENIQSWFAEWVALGWFVRAAA